MDGEEQPPAEQPPEEANPAPVEEARPGEEQPPPAEEAPAADAPPAEEAPAEAPPAEAAPATEEAEPAPVEEQPADQPPADMPPQMEEMDPGMDDMDDMNDMEGQQMQAMDPGMEQQQEMQEMDPDQQQQMYEQQQMMMDPNDPNVQQMMAAQQMGIDPSQMAQMTEEQLQQMQMYQQQQMMQQQQMIDGSGMPIDLSQMTPEEQQAYQQQLYEQQQQYAQQMMAAGQYDQQQFVDQMGNPISQEQYEQMLAQQQAYGEEMQDYGQEMMDPNQQQYMQEQRVEEDPIQDKIQKIIQICADNDALFGDSEFPANDSSLYVDQSSPPEYAQDMPVVEWKRPQEISPDNEPKMQTDPESPGDIKQGLLGFDDCWFLGSLLILSTNPELLKNLIYYDGIQYGFAVFYFFKNGRWQHVIVDTRIPYNSQTKTPLYGHNNDQNEFWVSLMEKAYAKLHGSYEKLHGGLLDEAMVDLTGGVSEEYNIKSDEIAEAIDGGQFWKDLKKYSQQGFLIGCENIVKDDHGMPEEGMGNSGILFNHAYGIQQIREVDSLQLVRIRNPWGSGDWTGKFCDEDEAWDDFKGLKEKLNYQFKSDGNWWMRFDDFCANFNMVYLCKIFPSTWSQYSITGEWAGNTAGGPYPPENLLGVETPKDQEGLVKPDTNSKWFNNPQFRITVKKKCNIILSVMQEDEKISKREYIPINFMVVRIKSKKDRLWEVHKDDIVLQANDGKTENKGQREITKNCTLTPIHDKKPVNYMIIPNAEVQNFKKDDERPFYLRIFSSDPIQLNQLQNTIEQQFQGKWTATTAGGRRVDGGKENQFWCKNPQYFLNITKPTHLKIILKKKGGKKTKGVTNGLTVTKAFSPTTPPATQIIHGQKGGNKMMSSIPTNGMTYAESLRLNVKTERGENIPEFIPPQLMNLERKLQILDGEWHVESSYQSDEVAALYAFYQPTQGPFIIVPSMQKEDYTSDFTLRIFSSQHVDIQMLEETRNAVISGKWTEKSAGGCHLYHKAFEQKTDKFTWITNPRFHLKLMIDPNQQARVKITLQRPQKAWKKQIGMNLVGCMIGFYVYPASMEPTKECIINREGTKFVPWNEISEEMYLDGNPDGYSIMCSTYEPGKTGPFILSLSTDVEFQLNALE